MNIAYGEVETPSSLKNVVHWQYFRVHKQCLAIFARYFMPLVFR